MKKQLSTFLAGALLTGSLFSGMAYAEATTSPTAAKPEAVKVEGAPFADAADHWAKGTIDLWHARGIIQGEENNEFKPDRGLTRAEWVALVNRIFQLQGGAALSFTDVQAGDWYAKEVQAAAGAGYITGYEDHTFKPGALLTREEAAVMISRILALKEDSPSAAFRDESGISGWAVKAVNAVSGKGIIQGFQDGSFAPHGHLTRAEAVTLLDRAFASYGKWYDEAKAYGPETGTEKVDGSVVISHAGATLQNMDIAGDLIISKAVGDGDVFLKNVTVHGNTYVYGGGEHSVHLENAVLLTVIVNKLDGTVRLVATGTTSVQEITVKSNATIEADQGSAISKLTLSNELPAKSRVMMKGEFDTVSIEAKSIMVQIPEGHINQLNVAKEAGETTLETSKEASILSLILNAAAKVVGAGAIDKAVINAEGVSLEQKPNSLSIGSDVPGDIKVSVGGAEQSVSAPPSNSGSGAPNNSSEGNSGGLDHGTWYMLKVESDTVTVGESVYVTSPRSGTLYLYPSNVNPEITMLEAGVEAGAVRKTSIQAGVRTAIDTTGFQYKPYSGFGVVVYDAQNKASNPEFILILDGASTPLIEHPEFIQGELPLQDGTKQQFIQISYNREIMPVPGTDLRSTVTVATYMQPFAPLPEEDGIQIVGNRIIITPKTPYGRNYTLSIAPGLLQTLDGQFQNAGYRIITSSMAHIQIVSPAYSANMKVKIGTPITFKSDRDGTFYFVLYDTTGFIEDEVANGYGRVINVPVGGVEETYQVDTSSLPPGRYMLLTLDSSVPAYVELVK